ncbi:MAG: CDC27 family protein [Alphaproteobacteria bacterium]|nr:CDC27 family protein [Alphaproteobacteria bacterium]
MPRNPVRAGRQDQRARAATRRREALPPRAPRAAGGPVEGPLMDWIQEHEQALGLDEPQQVDIGRFLHDTRHFDMQADERLRWLGVSLEQQGPASRAWPAALRAYRFGLGRSEHPGLLLESIAISAYELAPLLSPEQRADALREGQRAAREAIALEPEDPDHRFALGLVLYAERRADAALAAFREGVALGDRGRCQLYAAHCLHDQERWAEALAAYEAVNLGQLRPGPSWRVDVLKEQRAECRFHAGQPEQARAELDALLARYAQEPHLAYRGLSAALRRLCEALGEPYPSRYQALSEAGHAWDMARFLGADEE